MNNVFVLLWRYDDYSGGGVVRVYENKDMANYDFELMKEHGDSHKKYIIETVKFIGGEL